MYQAERLTTALHARSLWKILEIVWNDYYDTQGLCVVTVLVEDGGLTFIYSGYYQRNQNMRYMRYMHFLQNMARFPRVFLPLKQRNKDKVAAAVI